MQNVRMLVFSIIMLVLLLSVQLSPSQGQEVDGQITFTIHRISALDDMDGWGGGEAEWYYYIGVKEGDDEWTWEESNRPIASDQDDLIIDNTHTFYVSSNLVQFIIIVCEEDVSDDGIADISEDRPGTGNIDYSDDAGHPVPKPSTGNYYYGSYKGEWDLDLKSFTSESERADDDGDYYKTSGNFDGSTTEDNNDAAVWFIIESTITMEPIWLTDDDTDVDGMPNYWEYSHHLPWNDDINGGVDPNDDNDFDGDGFTDLIEYEHGTNPCDSLDFPPNMEPGTNNELTETESTRLAERFHPILLFDSDEEVFPTDADYHLDNSVLHVNDGTGSKYGPPVSSVDLLDIDNDDSYMDNIEEDITNDYRNERDTYGDVVYCYVSYSSYDNVEYIAVQYWFFYVYNDALNNHEGDWETITILLDNEQEPLYVAYSQHIETITTTGRETKPFDEVERSDDHVKIYVGKGSHANYFSEGTKVLSENSIYDQADGDNDFSLDVDESEIIILKDRNNIFHIQSWLDYPGLWGDDGPWGSSGPKGPKYRFEGECWDHPARWVLEDYNVDESNENDENNNDNNEKKDSGYLSLPLIVFLPLIIAFLISKKNHKYLRF